MAQPESQAQQPVSAPTIWAAPGRSARAHGGGLVVIAQNCIWLGNWEADDCDRQFVIRIQSLEQPEETEPEDEFDAPGGPAVSLESDLWVLDRHRLLCGSALAYEALLGSEKAAEAFTDPPYNVKINGHVTGKGNKRHREFAIASGEMSPSEFTGFLEQSFAHMMAYCSDFAVA